MPTGTKLSDRSCRQYLGRHSRAAFSLVEILAVLAIIGLVLAIAGVRWNGTFQQISFESAIDRLIDFESGVRTSAIRTGHKQTVVIDLGRNRIQTAGMRDDQPQVRTFKRPELLKLNSFWSVHQQEQKTGAYLLEVDRWGATDSFGLEVSYGAQSFWLFFGGVSGQVLLFEEKRQLEATFSSLRANGVYVN